MTSDLAQVLATAVARGDPTLYLDTNVLLDIIRPRRRGESRQLLETWQARSWTCMSSYFAIMEALDVEQESMWFRSMIRKGEAVDWLLRNRRRRDLTSRARGKVLGAFYKQFVAEAQDYINWLFLDDAGWEEAIRLAMQTDSSAPDCIHVATALSHGCDVLVTSDQPLSHTAAGEIEVATPEEVLTWLQTTDV